VSRVRLIAARFRSLGEFDRDVGFLRDPPSKSSGFIVSASTPSLLNLSLMAGLSMLLTISSWIFLR
jgi:hypothetical protein